jgi:hypothetical protein
MLTLDSCATEHQGAKKATEAPQSAIQAVDCLPRDHSDYLECRKLLSLRPSGWQPPNRSQQACPGSPYKMILDSSYIN